jgi:hypothetical protein
MQLDLTDEETAALAQLLRETIDADRYPLAAKLGLPGRHSDQVVHHATDPQVFAGGEQCRDALHVNRTGPLERTVLQRAGRSLRPTNADEVWKPVIRAPRGGEVERYPFCGWKPPCRVPGPSRDTNHRR